MITDPFNPIIDCCGTYSSDMQQKIATWYETISTQLFALIDKAYGVAIYGREPEQVFNRINDIHYLFLMLYIIQKRRQEYFDYTGEDLGLAYYYEMFNIDCIKRTFQCKGIDIAPLLGIFNLGPYPPGPTPVIPKSPPCPPMPDGIGSMHIESGPICENLFIIS